NMQQVYLDTGKPQEPDPLIQTLKQMAVGFGQNLGQISAPGIAASLLNQFRPGTQLPGPLQGATREALPLKDLPGQIAINTLPVIAGGIDEPAPAAQARPPVRPNAPAPKPPIDPDVASFVAKKLARKIPGVGLGSDVVDLYNLLKQKA